MLDPNLQVIRIHEVWLRPAHRVDQAKGRSSGHDAQVLYYRGELLGYSRDCIYAAAQILLKRGLADPDDVIQTLWDESGPLSLLAKVGEAARWTVVETRKRGPHLRRFRPPLGKVSGGGIGNCPLGSAKIVCDGTGQADISALWPSSSPESPSGAVPRNLTQATRALPTGRDHPGEGWR